MHGITCTACGSCCRLTRLTTSCSPPARRRCAHSCIRSTEYLSMIKGMSQSVRLFVERSFAVVGTTIKWVGEGVTEKGVDAKDEKRVLVAVDPAYFRPTEV